MPTVSHEAPILLFRENPELVAELLRDAAGIAIPPHDRLQIEDTNFAQIAPSEHRADLVLTLVSEGKPVMGIVVEVQLQPVARKRFVWPLYVAAPHARLGCAVCLVVVTADAETARWAAKPITTFQPGSPFTPIVIGPDQIPVVTSPEEASRAPELAVLSALAHGAEGRAAAIGRAALRAAGLLDEERRALYTDIVLHALGRELRATLEAEMNLTDYEFKSDFFKRKIAEESAKLAEKLAEKMAEKIAEERAEKIAEERAEKMAEKLAEKIAEKLAEERVSAAATAAIARSVLAVFAARGLPVSEEQRARIASCADAATLERWTARAVTAASAEEALQGA